MRPSRSTPVFLLTLLLAAVTAVNPGPAEAAASHGGGAAAPSRTGGGMYDAVPPAPRARPALVAHRFVVPRVIMAGGPPVAFAVRLRGPRPEARVAIHVRRPGGARPVARIDAGRHGVGVPIRIRWRPPASLPGGTYQVVLHVRDTTGRNLRRTARDSGRSGVVVRRPVVRRPVVRRPVVRRPVVTGSGRFPVQGPHDFGGPDARFGADRGGRMHQGQDILAAEGTPLVSPVDGTVYWRAHQESGAGHYLVIRGPEGDLVFMHLRPGSLLVQRGDAVRAGQRIADVGNSGRSSAAHLHFELWPDGWFAKGSKPVDPLPALLAWQRSSS